MYVCTFYKDKLLEGEHPSVSANADESMVCITVQVYFM